MFDLMEDFDEIDYLLESYFMEMEDMKESKVHHNTSGNYTEPTNPEVKTTVEKERPLAEITTFRRIVEWFIRMINQLKAIWQQNKVDKMLNSFNVLKRDPLTLDSSYNQMVESINDPNMNWIIENPSKYVMQATPFNKANARVYQKSIETWDKEIEKWKADNKNGLKGESIQVRNQDAKNVVAKFTTMIKAALQRCDKTSVLLNETKSKVSDEDLRSQEWKIYVSYITKEMQATMLSAKELIAFFKDAFQKNINTSTNQPTVTQNSFVFQNDFGNIYQEEAEYTSLKDVRKLCEELVFKHLDKEFEYGFVKDGKFKKHPSQKEIIKYHKLLSPEDFEKYGGGTCFDYVEYEQKWLSDKGVNCKKIWISEEMPMDQTEHTFIMIECQNQFIWVEPVLKKFKGVHVFSNKRDLFKTAAYWIFMCAKNPEHMDGVKYTVFDYTNAAIKYNTRVEDAVSYILGNAKWLFDDIVKESKGEHFKESYVVTESVDTSKYKPIFIVLMSGNSIISKSVQISTKSEMSHAGISFDANMDRIYSFAMFNRYRTEDSPKKSGFRIDSFFTDNHKNTTMTVYGGFLSESAFNKMQKFIEDNYIGKDDSVYSLGTIWKKFWKSDKARHKPNDLHLVCSTFVDRVLKEAGIDITGKNLPSPKDLDDAMGSDMIHFERVFHGKPADYDSDDVLDRMDDFAEYSKTKNLIEKENTTVTTEGYRHSMYDKDDSKEDQKKMIKLYKNIIFLKDPSNLRKMTKTECIDYLCETYNILAEIYDTIEEDYDEAPVKTSRLGFAKKPKTSGKHRKEIDRLIWEIRRNIIELNRGWTREGARMIVRKMLDVFEYEQRELNETAPVFNKLISNEVVKATNRVIGSIHESYYDFDTMELDDFIQEAKLSSDDRKELDDSQFGIPELRKYPLTDKKHVLQAVRFFNKAPDEYKHELAKNIVKRAKELGMDWENWESLKPYLDKKKKDEVVEESAKRDCNLYNLDFPSKKVYVGFSERRDKDDFMIRNEMFVTPYIGIASIFALSHNKEIGKYLRKHIPKEKLKKVNHAYKEWNYPSSILNNIFHDIHQVIEGYPQLEKTSIDCTGYVYEIDLNDIRGKYDIKYRGWMDPKKEALICLRKDNDGVINRNNKGAPIDFINIKVKEHIVSGTVHIEGGKSKNNNNTYQEAVYYLNPDNGNLGIMARTPKPVKDPSGKGKMYEMDEIIVPFIRLANKKGYKTRFCCSGHGPIGRVLDYKSEDESEYRKQTGEPYIFFVDNHEFKQLPPGWYIEKDMKGIHDYWGKGTIIRRKMKHVMHGDDHDDWQGYLDIYDEIVDAFKALCKYFEKLPDISNKHVQEAVDINSLRQQCGEVYQQALQIHYGCLDENRERITASPFKDSWKMISTYHSQSLQSLQESKLGVCFEHSFYVAELLKQRNLPCQTFFLNCNIDHNQPQEESNDEIQPPIQESESIAVEQHNMNDMSFWHQFTIVPNDTDSIVLIETSLTPDKNGVFLVANMDDVVSHLIQTFDLQLSQEDMEIMKQDLIDVSNFEMRDGDTYIGYIDQAYLNGKFIKNEIRINHQTKTMKTYWQYLADHQYLSEDGIKINDQIQQMDDNTAFDIINLLNAQPLFTEEGLKFHQSFFDKDKPYLSVSEMESQLKGFVQESYIGMKHNTLKEKFQYIPLTSKSIKEYASQGDFQYGMERVHMTKDTKGAIYINKNHVVVAYVAVMKKSNGQRWIVALEVSNEYKDKGYDTDLLQIAVDDFGAEYLSISPDQTQSIPVYQQFGFHIEDKTKSMIVLKLNKEERNDS